MSLVARCCRYSNPRCRQFPPKRMAPWQRLSFSATYRSYGWWTPACVSFQFHIDMWSDARFREISSGISVTPSDNRKKNLCWCDVTWVPGPFKSPAKRLFVHPVFKLTSNKILELHVTGPCIRKPVASQMVKDGETLFRCMTSSWSSWKHWYS